MIQLAPKDLCTGCGACAYKCPKSCITMKEDVQGVVYPHLDATNCIECHACEKACPILNPLTDKEPQRAYAAWSNDEEERRTSASGGVAIEIYKYCLKNGYIAVGASQNEDFSVTHKVARTEEELRPFKNSKYVFSDAYEAFPQIRQLLKDGEKVVFIGLPCQVSALRKLFNDHENLLLIEVVCHGTTPLSYLRQHIHYLESCEGQQAKRMSFRDPDTYTYTYTLTLYNEAGERFYAQQIKDGDNYQVGYHKAINYRENCYHCPFARVKRISDICLSDYKGLGKYEPSSYGNEKVSCILVYTPKGQTIIDNLVSHGLIHVDNKPIQEPVAGDPQLREPSKKKYPRFVFEDMMVKTNYDYENSMMVTKKRMKRHNMILRIVNRPKRLIKAIMRFSFFSK